MTRANGKQLLGSNLNNNPFVFVDTTTNYYLLYINIVQLKANVLRNLIQVT